MDYYKLIKKIANPIQCATLEIIVNISKTWHNFYHRTRIEQPHYEVQNQILQDAQKIAIYGNRLKVSHR